MWCFLTGCQLPLTRFFTILYVRIHSCSFVWALVQNLFLYLNLSRVQICNYVERVHSFRYCNYYILSYYWNDSTGEINYWGFVVTFDGLIVLLITVVAATPTCGCIDDLFPARFFWLHEAAICWIIPTALRPRRPFENVNTLIFHQWHGKVSLRTPNFFCLLDKIFPGLRNRGFPVRAPVRTKHERYSGSRWRCQITFRTLPWYPWARHWTLKRSHRALEWTAKSSRGQTYLHPYVQHGLKTERIQA